MKIKLDANKIIGHAVATVILYEREEVYKAYKKGFEEGRRKFQPKRKRIVRKGILTKLFG